MTEKHFKSGFVSIIGRPNVGKSTFLNQVLGKKIAIMSDKPQTTRNKIQGVITDADSQTIFIDTPGIHKPKHELGKFMTDLAIGTLNEVDAVMFGRNIRPVSFLYCAALTCIFSVIVNISMHNKLKKIDMVESLKSVE